MAVAKELATKAGLDMGLGTCARAEGSAPVAIFGRRRGKGRSFAQVQARASASGERAGVSAEACAAAGDAARTQTYAILEWTDDRTVTCAQVPIIGEYRIRIEVNGAACVSIMCTPGEDREMVIGRLFTEGFIDGMEDIQSLEFERAGECLTVARVVLSARGDVPAEVPAIDIATTGSCGQVSRRFSGRFHAKDYLTPGEFGSWRVQDVLRLDRLFSKDSPLHKLTSGTHSCYMMRDGTVVHCSEDIGRHNTVDKAIGWALINGVDMTQLIAFISGRVPTDMMRKAVRAKFGVLASRKAPTREAIDMARTYRITLVGDVEKGRLRVYSGMQPL